MALVSATASLHLPVPSAVIGGSAACSFPQLRRPFPAPLRAAKGANSSPVVLGSKVKGKKKKGSGAGNLSGALDVEIREAQESLDRDEQVCILGSRLLQLS
jgi:complement component 1 Q subcomponent-binding protein, mitochondrial